MAAEPGLSVRLSNVPFWIVAWLAMLHAAALAMDHVFVLTGDQPWRFLHHQFNLDREVNFATWAATALLLAAAALLGLIALERRWSSDRWHRHWGALAVLFLLLSLDEMCSFHERLSDPVGNALETSGGIFTNAWVLIVVPLVVVVFAAFVPFLRCLAAATRWHFIGAGVIFVVGAAGVELLSGLLRDLHGYRDARFAAATTVEELLELFGVAFFLRALILHMGRTRTLESLVMGPRSDELRGEVALDPEELGARCR